MVRAAITGAFNYAGSDPTDKKWKIRHRLIIAGMMDNDDKELLQTLHRHWLGYLAHGNLTPESFERVKTFATEVLQDIKKAIYPWRAAEEPQQKNAIISAEDNDLIARYKAYQEKFRRETTGK